MQAQQVDSVCQAPWRAKLPVRSSLPFALQNCRVQCFDVGQLPVGALNYCFVRFAVFPTLSHFLNAEDKKLLTGGHHSVALLCFTELTRWVFPLRRETW